MELLGDVEDFKQKLDAPGSEGCGLWYTKLRDDVFREYLLLPWRWEMPLSILQRCQQVLGDSGASYEWDLPVPTQFVSSEMEQGLVYLEDPMGWS